MRYHNSPNSDEDKFFDEDDFEDDKLFFEEEKEIKLATLNLVAFNLNRRILTGVVKMLENSFWWKFLSYKTKLKMISDSYHVMNKLIEEKQE